MLDVSAPAWLRSSLAGVRMTSGDPILIGLKSFVFWGALSCCWFLLAHSVARFAFGKLWTVRLLFLAALLAAWGFLVPATTKAHIGNGSPEGADRRAAYMARSSGKFYGAQTIWAWGLLVVIGLPRLKHRGLQTC